MFTRLMARLRRARLILDHNLFTPGERNARAFVAMLGGGVSATWLLGRTLRLYARAIRKFRAAGATWTEAFLIPASVPALIGGNTWITDLGHNVLGGMALKIAAYTTTQAGTAVDMLLGFGNLFGIAVYGTMTDGTHALKLTECDTSGGSYTDVAGGGFPATPVSDTFAIVTGRRTKRFIKAASTISGSPSTGGIYGVLVLQMVKDA
jgi:hypothetical protein